MEKFDLHSVLCEIFLIDLGLQSKLLMKKYGIEYRYCVEMSQMFRWLSSNISILISYTKFVL